MPENLWQAICDLERSACGRQEDLTKLIFYVVPDHYPEKCTEQRLEQCPEQCTEQHPEQYSEQCLENHLYLLCVVDFRDLFSIFAT